MQADSVAILTGHCFSDGEEWLVRLLKKETRFSAHRINHSEPLPIHFPLPSRIQLPPKINLRLLLSEGKLTTESKRVHILTPPKMGLGLGLEEGG
jgi:hypothetical protein